MSTGNGLATDLMQLGITAQAAGYLGAGAYTTVAAAGTTQGAGTAITQFNTNVKATTAGGATALVLPSNAFLEVTYSITNTSATAALVYPPSGGNFNNGAANASYTVSQNQTAYFTRKSTTQWSVFSTSEPNILSTANSWNGTQTFAVAIVPTGGVGAAGGFTVRPSNWHTGALPPATSAAGTDATPTNTETYICAVFVPANATITGVRLFNGSVASGNVKYGLFDSAGTNVATTASTAMSGTDAYQQIAFSAPYAAVGPATYYVALQVDNSTARINMHPFGAFPASKKTGETYGTWTSITPPTTFTADVGPMATLY